jgi:hypothetical protein
MERESFTRFKASKEYQRLAEKIKEKGKELELLKKENIL